MKDRTDEEIRVFRDALFGAMAEAVSQEVGFPAFIGAAMKDESPTTRGRVEQAMLDQIAEWKRTSQTFEFAA